MSWFGTSEQVVPYKVWRTRGELLKGVGIEAMKAVREGNRAIVIFFFKSRMEECKSFFNQNGIPFTEEASSTTPGIFLLMSANASSLPADAKSVVLVFGVYPLPAKEAALLEKFSAAKTKSYCASLEDPMFKAFGMEKVATLMETLGMKDGEHIEHRFVDKAIGNAREKLAMKVKHEVMTETEEEWFLKNIPKH